MIQKLFKDGIEIDYNAAKGHLSITSNDISKVLDTLVEFQSVIERIMNVFPPVEWYEFNIHSRVYSSAHSLDVTPVADSKLIALLNETTGLSVKPYTWSICAHGNGIPQKPLNTIPDWMHLSYGPYVKNPRDHYMNLVYRRRNLDDVKLVIKKHDEIIKDVADSTIGGE